jgi:uncharacterized membrane protein YhhN
MNPLFPISALCALAYLPMASRPQGNLRSLIKTCAVVGLALAAALTGATELALALGLCSLGDLLLSRDGDGAFAAGVAAFAAGHVAYILLFLGLPGSTPVRLVQVPAAWGVLVILGLGVSMARLLAPRAGALRLPVLIYIPIILGMGLAALTLPFNGPFAWVQSAALAFILSDLILAVEKFLLPAGHRTRRVNSFLIWGLYWGAQAGFFLALNGGGA